MPRTTSQTWKHCVARALAHGLDGTTECAEAVKIIPKPTGHITQPNNPINKKEASLNQIVKQSTMN